MGASGWHARVPFQSDIAAALQQARQQAYDRGDFYRDPPSPQALAMSEEEYIALGIAEAKAWFPDDDTWNPSDTAPREEWRAAHVVVTGPDSLVEAQPFSAAHSIIDMTHVSDEPDHQAVAPATNGHLRQVFGTTQPTPDAIETAINDRQLVDFGGWRGMYLVGYRDGLPVEIFFVGHSGD